MVNIDQIIVLCNNYLTIIKNSYIKKLPNGKWRVFSEKGRNMGTYDSQIQAKKRLRQIEFFKHKKASSEKEIDLTDIPEPSLSAIMRELNKQCDKETVYDFLSIFKIFFDLMLINEVSNPDEKALTIALAIFGKNIKLSEESDNNNAEYTNAQLVGKYLSDIIKFTLSKISLERRPKSIQSLKNKLYQLNDNQLASKKMPPSASIGQSISFVKNVLFNNNPNYIRQVINSIVAYL